MKHGNRMKTFFARVAAVIPLAIVFAGLGASAEPILWFSVSAMSAVDDGSETPATVADYINSGEINAARVRVTGPNIDKYLPLFFFDETTGEWQSADDLTGYVTEVVFGIDGVDWQPADMDVNSFDMSPYSFDLEIGTVGEDFDQDFNTIAFASATYNALNNGGYVSHGGVTTQGQTPWTPTTFRTTTTVPEPGVPILALTGMAMLFGRRRRAVSC